MLLDGKTVMSTYLFPVPRDSAEQLGRYYNLVSWEIELLDSFTGNDLAHTIRVDVGRVEKVDTAVVGGLDKGERFLLFDCRIRLVNGLPTGPSGGSLPSSSHSFHLLSPLKQVQNVNKKQKAGGVGLITH